ncbi:MAG: M48 family metalloprotease [Gemmatimonadaceae bacterium]|jgi:predicted Zn-dependent protease|nr:M48 family metalloprotease [Gemmatimonadaceae bacterium]
MTFSRLPRRFAARIAATFAVLTSVSGCLASTQQEVDIGNQYAAQVDQQLPLIRDPEVARYITVLGDSIARVSDDRSLRWTFQVVDQPDINAFAVPGGHIYVYRGLIEKTATMSELAGVLGHEIAHVTQRHSMLQMRDQQRANVGVTLGCILAPAVCNSGVGNAALQLGGGAAFAKFSRDDEAEADKFGVTYITRAGIDPRGMPSMFRTLMAERKTNPSGLDNFFASHPVEESRVAHTEAEIKKLDPVVIQSLTKDSRAFQAFKARLASLPRSSVRK